jgi:hypothetical protein
MNLSRRIERYERIKTEECDRNNQTKVLAIPSYHSIQPEFADFIARDTRLASRADAATVTARQFRPIDDGGASINSDSSSQSSSERPAPGAVQFRHRSK